MNFEENLQARAAFFKALGNPTRLLIINLIRIQPRHTEELASILKLSAGTVSHHLSNLLEAGLLSSKKEQYYQTYSLKPDVLEKSIDEVIAMPQPSLAKDVEPDAFRSKVLKTYFDRGRLVKIPKQRKKLMIVLEEIARAFELTKVYSEREVNIIIADFHDDFATLRRELVNFKFMKREKDGSAYTLLTTTFRV